FGKRYAAKIHSLENLELRYDAEVKSFSFKEGSPDVVDSLLVKNTKDDKEDFIRAGHFVIAAGTQESTRLLLRNPSLFNSIGGPPSSLGKFYQGHVSGKIATVKFYGDPRKTDFGFIKDKKGIYL